MSDLNTVVFGELKNTRLESRRQRMTRFGLARNGRTVLDEWPLDLAVPATAAPHEPTSSDLSRQRAIVKSQISEAVQRPEYVELVLRRLFNGESVTSLAQELGIKSGTASSVVRRAKIFLGLID